MPLTAPIGESVGRGISVLKSACAAIPVVVAVATGSCATPDASAAHSSRAGTAALALDHAWIAVPKNGPERKLLESAGFLFAPTVNRHEGQGTASISIEFENAFLELIWPDDEVTATGGGAIAQQRFVSRMNWRTTGDSPLGVGLRRTSATPTSFPFPTWKVTAAWMGPDGAMEILSPRGSKTVTFFVYGYPVDEAANLASIRSGKGAHFLHPNGARRLTALRITAPGREALPPAARFIEESKAVSLRVGAEWLMEAELDNGRQGQRKDLRPELPLMLSW